jgi:hypothetical protein
MDHQPKWKQMTTAACQDAFIFLHSRLNEGELEHGAMAQAARLFSVSHKAMALFWREMNKKIEKMEISMLMTFLLTHCSLRTIGKTGDGSSSGTGRS